VISDPLLKKWTSAPAPPFRLSAVIDFCTPKYIKFERYTRVYAVNVLNLYQLSRMTRSILLVGLSSVPHTPPNCSLITSYAGREGGMKVYLREWNHKSEEEKAVTTSRVGTHATVPG
jgi:hypothetical protein